MASLPLAPRLIRRGLEVFAAISLVGFVGLLLYGNNLNHFLGAMVSIRWRWALVAIALASLDWLGGGLRLYVLCRHVYPQQSLKGAILAGGLNTWASYLTPSQTGGGPVMIYALKRYGTPFPEAMAGSLMSFIATVLFFAVAGPLAIALGAGRSLQDHGILGQTLDLYDLFALSLGGFITVGLVILLLVLFPKVAHRVLGALRHAVERRGRLQLGARIAALEDGVERSHASIRAYFRGRGWIAIVLGVLLTTTAHANKLLAGFVVLKMLGIPAPFFEVLLLQTLITFLLYFAPTPGGSGLAELISAAVMSIYVPRVLTPSYILLWRVTVSYLTVVFGSVVFWRWLREAEAQEDEPSVA